MAFKLVLFILYTTMIRNFSAQDSVSIQASKMESFDLQNLLQYDEPVDDDDLKIESYLNDRIVKRSVNLIDEGSGGFDVNFRDPYKSQFNVNSKENPKIDKIRQSLIIGFKLEIYELRSKVCKLLHNSDGFKQKFQNLLLEILKKSYLFEKIISDIKIKSIELNLNKIEQLCKAIELEDHLNLAKLGIKYEIEFFKMCDNFNLECDIFPNNLTITDISYEIVNAFIKHTYIAFDDHNDSLKVKLGIFDTDKEFIIGRTATKEICKNSSDIKTNSVCIKNEALRLVDVVKAQLVSLSSGIKVTCSENSKRCSANSVCVEIALSSVCKCKEGFSRKYLNEDCKYECDLNCKNEGRCVFNPNINKSICVCGQFYFGSECQYSGLAFLVLGALFMSISGLLSMTMWFSTCILAHLSKTRCSRNLRPIDGSAHDTNSQIEITNSTQSTIRIRDTCLSPVSLSNVRYLQDSEPFIPTETSTILANAPSDSTTS